MIQNYLTLKGQVNQINSSLGNGGMVQKIFSTSRYLALGVRVPGKTCWIYLGRGGGFEGIWCSETPPESSLRARDGLLEYLRKHLMNTHLVSLQLDKEDRIISFKYLKWRKLNLFSYFYKGREAYFAHHYYEENEERVFTSWSGYESHKELSDLFQEIGRKSIGKEGVIKEKLIKDLLLEEKKLLYQSKDLKKEKKFKKRKKEKMQEDLEQAKKWKVIQGLAKKWKEEILENNFSPLKGLEGKRKIEGIRFDFRGVNKDFDKLETIFKKTKKLKKTQEFLEKRMRDLEQEKLTTPEKRSLKIIKPVWKKVTDKRKAIEQKKYDVFRIGVFSAAVGKDAQANDFLRIHWSKKEDWWFHIENTPGAHLYLKSSDQKFIIEPSLLTIIGSILKDYSQFEGSEVPLVYTQVKNLKGVKGRAGAVLMKKEKKIQVYYKKDWKSHV